MQYYKRNLFILSSTIFLAAVSWNQVMPFLQPFLSELGLRGRDLNLWTGAVFSLQSFASIAAMPFWGKLGDRYGRKPMILRAGVFLSLIYFATSIIRAPWQLVLVRFLNGALTGFIPGSMALIATNTPQRYATRYVAIAQAASAAGQLAGPVIGSILVEIAGYRGSMRLSGSAVLISTILVLLLVREENTQRSTDSTSLWNDFLVCIRSPILASLMLATMVQYFVIVSVNPFLVSHVSGLQGTSPGKWFTGVVFALPAFALMLTAPTWAKIGEKVGHERALLIGIGSATVAYLSLSLVTSLWAFTGLFLICGIFTAVVLPATAAITVRDVPDWFRGRAMGMQLSAGVFGSFLAPIFAAWISAVYGTGAIFALNSIVLVLGAAGIRFLAVRVPVRDAG